MSYNNKTREELIAELQELKQKNDSLEALLKGTDEQKHDKETFYENEEMQNLIINTVRDPITMVRLEDNICIKVNKGFLDLLGWSEEEIIGKTFKDVSVWVNEEERDRMIALLNKNGYVDSFEANFRGKNNNIITGLLSAKILTLRSIPYLVSITRDITEHKRIEEELRESKLKEQFVIENTDDLLWGLNSDFTFDYVSPSVFNFLGYTVEEHMKHTLDDYLTPESAKMIKEEFREGMINLQNKEYHKLRNIVNKEIEFIRKDKTRGIGLITIIMVRDEQHRIKKIRGKTTDITERKHAEKELIESEAKFHSIFDQSSVGLLIVGLDKRFIRCNKAFCNFLGYKEAELIGKTIAEVTHPDDVESGMNLMALLAGTQMRSLIVQKRYIKKNGDVLWAETNICLGRDENNKPIFLMPVIQDISQRKTAENNLIKAKEKAEESDRLKTAFLANMSHEIRTPMNGILGFAGLLKEGKLTGEERYDYISLIEKSGARMLNILNDIISISKVESGRLEVNISETNINEQIKFIYDFFKLEAEQKGISLSCKNPFSVDDIFVKTDSDLLYAVLTNLVKNALKFTGEGAIEFGYNLKSVNSSGDGEEQKESAELEFFVKDTGIGISEERKELIFERFRQGSELLTRNYEGAGLGLSIAKAYVEKLGGKIWVESEFGKGSVFYFTIPYHIAKLKKEKNNFVDTVINEGSKIKNLKILVAEDDEISLKLISIVIKPFCKEIIKARSGIDAVEACRNNPDIDAVLIDIKMPEIDGYEATKEIRRMNKDVVIIAQTAFGLTGDREKAIDAGCNDYILKPINQQILVELMSKHLKANPNVMV